MRLSDYGISSARGFLPNEDPLDVLPREFSFLDEFGRNLPELIAQDRVNQEASNLPIPDFYSIIGLDGPQLRLAHLRYDFIQSACVHTQKEKPQIICRNIAKPVWLISKILFKPPILSYDSYTLNNWKRKDKDGPIKVDNLELIQTFIEDSDQSWFILIHVDIEAEAALAIRSLREAVLAVERDDTISLGHALLNIDRSLDNIVTTMRRMPEGTSPETYYRIRPWIMSFDDVIYEGVDEFSDKPQSLRGQTGAQSSIFQAIEAGLQTPSLEDNHLSRHLKDMRNYMLAGHRRFILDLEETSGVRDHIVSTESSLDELYDSNMYKILLFLAIHLGYAFFYIHKKTSNPKGTGGTPDFMDYLEGRIKERWVKAFIKPRSEDDFKSFMIKARKIVKELVAG